MRRFAISLIITLVAIVGYAEDITFKVDGLNYRITSTGKLTVELVSCNTKASSIGIPEQVVHYDRTFTVISIGDDAFQDCNKLVKIDIPNTILYVGANAFANCTKLKEVAFGNSIRRIGTGAFYNCTKLKEAILPNSIVTIGSSAFRQCRSMESVVLSTSLQRIERNTFLGCESLKKVDITPSVKKIGDNAFSNCSQLEAVNIPNSVVAIGYDAFRNCNSLYALEIPESVTKIGARAFDGCYSLSFVKFKGAARKIGGYAFNGCNALETVVLSKSAISDSTFATCSSVTSVVSLDGKPGKISNNTFSQHTCLGKLYVPTKSRDNYLKKKGWTNFCEVVEGIPSDLLNPRPRPEKPVAKKEVTPQQEDKVEGMVETQANAEVSQAEAAAIDSVESEYTFKVVVLASYAKMKQNNKAFKGLSPIQHYTTKNRGRVLYNYTFGSETSYAKITEVRNSILKKFPKSYITAFKDGKRVGAKQLNSAIEAQP